jgi:hypothetical protein
MCRVFCQISIEFTGGENLCRAFWQVSIGFTRGGDSCRVFCHRPLQYVLCLVYVWI